MGYPDYLAIAEKHDEILYFSSPISQRLPASRLELQYMNCLLFFCYIFFLASLAAFFCIYALDTQTLSLFSFSYRPRDFFYIYRPAFPGIFVLLYYVLNCIPVLCASSIFHNEFYKNRETSDFSSCILPMRNDSFALNNQHSVWCQHG